MPRLTDASRQQRREAIAAAALRCFARDGFANTSMADIINEAGSSAGSVYSHFSGKAELLRFAASNALDELVASVREELPAHRTPAGVLAQLLRVSGERAHAQLLVQIWAEVPRDLELEDVALQSLDTLRDLVRSAVLPWCREHRSIEPEAGAEALADATVSAIQGFLVTITIDRRIDADLLASHVVAVFALL